MPTFRRSPRLRLLAAWNHAVLLTAVGATILGPVAAGAVPVSGTAPDAAGEVGAEVGASGDPPTTADHAVPAAGPPQSEPVPPPGTVSTAVPTSAPLPAAPPVTSPAPSAAPTTTAPSTETIEARVQRAFDTATPAVWRSAVPTRLEIIGGSTSWAHSDGTISISRFHGSSGFDHLTDVVAHEFGHLIAFRHGTGEYAGAAPAGWPAPPANPAEAWADCVQTVFTGRENPSHGLGPCRGEQLTWARSWLDAGPPADV